MNTFHRFVLSLSILICFSGILFPQSIDGITVGGTLLKIGMSKSKVLASIDTTDVRIQQIAGVKDAFVIQEKPTQSNPFWNELGIITFRDNRLFSASREWNNSHNDDAISLVRSLISALSQFASTEPKLASIVKYEADQPAFALKGFRITVGEKTIGIQLGSDMKSGKQNALIYEMVEAK